MIFARFLCRMMREQKLRLIIVVAFMGIVALLEGATVALLVPLMKIIMGEQGVLPGILGDVGMLIENVLTFLHIELSLVVALSLLVVAFIVQGIFRLLMWHLQSKMLANYEYSLIHRLFDSYLASSWGFFVHSKTGQLVNMLSVETQRALVAFQSVCQFLASSLVAIFYITISLLASWEITLGGVVLCLVAVVALKKFPKRAFSYGGDITKTNSEFQSYAVDKLSAAKLLKSSATEKNAVDSMDAITQHKVYLTYLSWMNSALVPSFYPPLVIAVFCLIIYVAITQLQINFAIILVFTYIFFRLNPFFSILQLTYQQALLNIPALQEIDRSIELARSMAETKGSKQIDELKEGIVFDNVGFAYQGGVTILKNINLEIKRGESIAIVGESGVGKTTIIDLLLGLLTPTEGQIMIDGIPLADYNLASWRKLVGHISQDVFLFHDTVGVNLKWLVPSVSQEQVEASAKIAYAHEFIINMDNGYDSIIGDRGVRLSGGQRQRLALARIILQNPDIIIMDEATSALDADSEVKIQEALVRITPDKTVVISSHSTSMLKDVDHVYLLESGNIVEVVKEVK